MWMWLAVLIVPVGSPSQTTTPGSQPAQTQPSGSLLRLVQTIALPEVKGRLDHLAADPTHQQLFVAAVENNTLEVLDLAAGKRVRSVPGFAEPQGVLYLPGEDMLVVANGSGLLQFLDRSSFRQVDKYKFDDDADNIRYDPVAGQVFVGYGEGGLAYFDARRHRWLHGSSLAGHPESFQVETKGRRVFINVPNSSEPPHVKVLLRRDPNSMAIADEWYLGDARKNYPMALDEADGRLFVGCREPAVLLVLDTASGKIVDRVNIDGDADDIFYDGAARRLYISCGAGWLDVVQQRDADYHKVVERLTILPGARTCLLVPQARRLYVAVPQYEGRPAEVRVYEIPGVLTSSADFRR